MSPAAAPSIASDHDSRITRLEEWRKSQEQNEKRRDEQSKDFEARLRVVEAAHLKMAARFAAWATVGSFAATVAVQVLMKVFWGH